MEVQIDGKGGGEKLLLLLLSIGSSLPLNLFNLFFSISRFFPGGPEGFLIKSQGRTFLPMLISQNRKPPVGFLA